MIKTQFSFPCLICKDQRLEVETITANKKGFVSCPNCKSVLEYEIAAWMFFVYYPIYPRSTGLDIVYLASRA